MAAEWIPPTTRPQVMGTKYMVSTGHYLASLAATRILDKGGNAVDAGVTAGLCLNVTQPDLTNIGGVAPITLRMAETDRVYTISGLGMWPNETDVENLRDLGSIPAGMRRSVVPAAIGSWLTALERFGTLTLAEVAESAIELAENGFAVHSVMHDTMTDPATSAGLHRWPSTSAIFLRDGHEPHRVGDVLVQTDLAKTLTKLVEASAHADTREGGIAAARDRFYRGDIADAMVRFSREQGGWLSSADLADFEAEVEEAVSVTYRGYEVYACGPWCQGPTVLQTLNILEGYDFSEIPLGSTDYYHLVLEALKCSFADRDRYFGDPRFVNVPLDGLLSKDYAATWRSRIDPQMATPEMPMPGNPWKFSTGTPPESTWTFPDLTEGQREPDTSYLCVVDSDGNAFSATPSDGVRETPIVPGHGFVISSRGVQSWVDPRHPSSLQPGKRPRLTPNPGLVLKRGEFVMPYGTPGGDVQPQAMVQFLLSHLDYDLDLQMAVETPRAATYSFPDTHDPHPYAPGVIKLESRAGDDVAGQLSDRGHRVQMWPAWTGVAGSIGAVRANTTANNTLRFHGAADPRRVAYALGW